MSGSEWITDRLPTEADGDGNGDVRVRSRPGSSEYNFAHWSYVGPGAPWQRTSYWKPPTEPAPTEPDRIAALEQQLKGLMEAQSVLAAALVKRLEALEGLPPDGAIPEGGRGVPGGIAALEQRVAESIHALEQRLSSLEQLFWAHKHLDQRVAELEATIKPSAESPEDISYQQLKVEQMRTSAALLIAHANLIEAQP